jgi:hypothetical protein
MVNSRWAIKRLGVSASCISILLGCGAATEDQLRTRAAFDLDCPAKSITIVELDGASSGVSGCGQRATYVKSCDRQDVARTCTWVLNGDARKTSSEK